MALVFITWVAYALFVWGVIRHRIVLADFHTSIIIMGVMAVALLIWSIHKFTHPNGKG